MTRDSLITYKRDNFQKYIKKREKEEVKIITFAFIEMQQDDLASLYEEDEIDLDITGIVQIIDKGNLHLVEKFFYLLNEYKHINYIVEEQYAKKALETFGVFFDNLIPSDSDEDKKSRHTGLGKDSISKKTIVKVKEDRIKKLSKHLDISLIGHERFKKNLIMKIEAFRFFNKEIKDQPIMSVFLVGDSGVGKTEVARILHTFLDKKSTLAKINFANYNSENSLASLIGSPPGFVNSGMESDLVKKLNNSQAGVLLVDEFEKAHPAVHNFFLQLLEDGQFDDAMGEVYNLKGYIIIFTSNLNIEEYSNLLPAELKSRFDMVTHFGPLRQEEKELYAIKTIDQYNKKSGKKLSVEDKSKIMIDLDLNNENNLRNITGKIRSLFFEFISKN